MWNLAVEQHAHWRPGRRPRWRKAGRDEGFRITGRRGAQWEVRRVSRHTGQVRVPKVGWVRFRWSHAVPPGVKSYRVTRDRAGRWNVAFAAIPEPLPAPGNGQVAGIDRGVAISAALSTGELLHVPGLTAYHDYPPDIVLSRRVQDSERAVIVHPVEVVRCGGGPGAAENRGRMDQPVHPRHDVVE